MRKLSVIVNGISNNERFLNSLFTEIGDEITAEIKDNEVLFYDIDGKADKLFNVLAKNVLNEFEKKILVKIINKSCDYLSKSDKYEIWKIAMRRLLDDEIENNADYIYKLKNVECKLQDFLTHSDVVSVEGFVNFRLRELEEDLEEMVEECVQDYLLELEYTEFVNMLKYYMSLQKPKYFSVEIVFDKNVLIYADGKDVTSECLKMFNDELCSVYGNKEDFILNSLITIAPKKIVIKHKKKLSSEFKKTLLGIFENKINFTTE